MVDSNHLDDKLRVRLAEIRASAGVPHSQLALEVLYFLPAAFLGAYEELFRAAVKSDGGEGNRNTSQQQAADVGKAEGVRGGAKPQKKRYKKTFVVLDERLLNAKTRFDKRLRGLAREIERELLGEVEGAGEQPKCTNCARFLPYNTGWKYCPGCGHDIVAQS